MSSIVLSGDTSGQVSLTVPAIAGSNTATIPASTGNVLMDSTVGVCRAWVNFNGVTTATIRSSFNVSSVTRNGTGDYTITFTNALSDANYATNLTLQRGDGAGVNPGYACIYGTTSNAYTSITASSVRIITASSSTSAQDMPYVGASIFR